MAKEIKRINFNLPIDLLETIDSYAEAMCVNRTSAIMFLIQSGLEYKKTMDILPQMLGAISDLKELEKGTKK